MEEREYQELEHHDAEPQEVSLDDAVAMEVEAVEAVAMEVDPGDAAPQEDRPKERKEEHKELTVDPKITVALIGGLFSFAGAVIPLMSDTEQHIALVAVSALIALVLLGICVLVLYQKKIYWGIVGICLLLAGGGASVYFAKRVVPVPAGLSYVDTTVAVYAGTGERAFRDGPFADCAFVAPACMSAYQESLYVTDSDRVRRLERNEAFTEPFPSSRYNALMVRNLASDVYVLAENRQMESGVYYNFFVRIRNGEAEVVSTPFDVGVYASSVSDFAFSKSGVLWLIRVYDAPGDATATLEKLSYDRDAERYGAPEWVMDFHYEADDMKCARMAFDAEDNLYISVPMQGVILRQGREEAECTLFAGVEGELVSNDKGAFTFSYPTALLPENGGLYVLDNGLVRRVKIDGGRAVGCETLAGVTPDLLRSGSVNIRPLTPGESAVGQTFYFPADERASLMFDSRGRLLLSDPVNSFLYEIREV